MADCNLRVEAGRTHGIIGEQNADMALALAHRAAVLETGAITLVGDAAALREDERVKAAYLGA